MKFLLIFLFLFSLNYLNAQNFNIILRVNNEVIYSEITNMYIESDIDSNSKRFSASYYPGDLTLDIEAYKLMQIDTINKYKLHFDYNTFKGQKHYITSFEIELEKELLKQPYLIYDVFDFRDKRYKHWYQYLTKGDYLVQVTCNGCGKFIQRR